jgi:uncharacterized membrane protein
VVLGTLLTVSVIFLPVINETPLRVVVGLPFVLFIPGYAFIAALFPEAGESPTSEKEADDREDDPYEDRTGIDGIERVALAFGTSIAIVPLLGLVLNFTPWGIRLVPIVVAISGFTLAVTAIAAQRRWDLPPEERFRIPYERWLADARAELFEPDSQTDAALNVLLAISVVLAVASVGYAVAVPQQGESFSEFYLLTEDENGDLVADEYPTEFTRGESRTLVVGIGNHEHERTNYSVVVELHRVQVQNNSTSVLAVEELDRYRTQLASNETWHLKHNVTPTMTGRDLRLTYLLYRGDAPANPSVDTAYRELHLWINVTEPDATQASSPPSVESTSMQRGAVG